MSWVVSRKGIVSQQESSFPCAGVTLYGAPGTQHKNPSRPAGALTETSVPPTDLPHSESAEGLKVHSFHGNSGLPISCLEQLSNKRNCLCPTTHSTLITQNSIISHQGVTIPPRMWHTGSTNTQNLLACKDSIYYCLSLKSFYPQRKHGRL